MWEGGSFYSVSLLVLLLCDVYTTIRCEIRTEQFLGDSSLKDKICIESERLFQVSARSKILCSQMCGESSACNSIFYNALTGSCTACKGYTNVEELTGNICFTKTVTPDLEGKKFKIHVKTNDRFWHFDGNQHTLKSVTTKWQPNDNFVKFMFEKQVDGSYKIKSVAMPIYLYDSFGVTDAYAPVLNGNDNTDDDHMRYHVSMETQDYYRIQTKSTGRYVRVDEDQFVTSKYNLLDDRSLFKLVEV